MKQHILVLSAFLGIVLIACNKEKFDFKKTSFDAEFTPTLGVPLVYGSITLGNIVDEIPDTLEFYDTPTDPDLRIKLFHHLDTTVTPYDLIDYPQIEEIVKEFEIGEISLDDQEASYDISFEDFLDYFPDEADNFFKNNDGATINTDDYYHIEDKRDPVPDFNSFDWVTFSKGHCKVKATNNYPVPVKFKVQLISNGAVLGEIDFTKPADKWIEPTQTLSDTFSLAGKTFENGKLEYRLTEMQIKGTTITTIDYDSDLTLSATVKDVVISSGRAVIPSQFLSMDTTSFFTVDTYKDRKLHHIEIETGSLDISANASIVQNLKLVIGLPSVTRDGKEFKDSVVLKKGVQTFTNIDLANTKIDLQQNPDQRWNSLPFTVGYHIEATNGKVEFQSVDKVSFTISNNEKVTFSYVDGNFGNDFEEFSDEEVEYDFDEFLKNYEKGKIVFTDPKLKFDIYNSIGVSGKFNLKLEGVGIDGDKMSLFTPDVKVVDINGPALADKDNFVPSHDSLHLTRETSNIVDFISILPEYLRFNGNFQLNSNYPADLPGDSTINFLYDTSKFRVNASAEIPMEFYINDLVLSEEFAFGLPDDVEELESLKIYLWEENHFPFDIKVSMVMLDTVEGIVLDTLAVNLMTAATTVDDQSKGIYGKAEKDSPTIHEEIITIPENNSDKRLEYLRRANKIKAIIEVNTEDGLDNTGTGERTITMYTHYAFKFKLSIDAGLKINLSEDDPE